MNIRNLGILLLAALSGAACAPDGGPRSLEASSTTGAGAPQRITITATDFAFDAPATIPAGLTTIHLVNRGPELHHVQIVRLEQGRTLADVRDWAQNPGPIPEWMHMVGGPNTPAPGKESEATVELPAGEYALLCVIPSPDGVWHLGKGMMRGITVTEPAGPPAEMTADLEMTLDDYSFATSAPLQAGRRTIRVTNAAAQPHELILVKLAPGKSTADMLAWLHNMQGPPPGEPVGGTTFLSQGQVNYVTGEFAPGEYALLCMVPDAADGRPHVAHGMVRQITVS